jgi:thiamine-monophosphate kinase
MTDPRGELAFIQWIRSQLPGDDPRVAIGPGDDMAELRLPGGGRVLVATDTILDGTHFDARCDCLADVGWKALAENLSDIAAMAAVPVGAVGTLALPRDFTMDQARDLFGGLKRCADQFDCPWVGGDITSWDQRLAVTVTVLAHAERPVRRCDARVGHVLCVTGRLGGSLLGRHLAFRPRVAEARGLAAAVTLGAMIDLSDGLSTDVGHLCRESRVGVRLDAQAVPVSDAARQMAARDGRSPLDHALNDGEDFELLFTVAEADAPKVLALDLGVEVTVIGRMVPAAEGRTIVDSDGGAHELQPGGYEHWR